MALQIPVEQRSENGASPSVKMDFSSLVRSWVSAYLVCGVGEGEAERLHGSDHGLHGQVDVLEYQLGVAPLVLISVASSMDDPHLFDEGALPALSSTCTDNQLT